MLVIKVLCPPPPLSFHSYSSSLLFPDTCVILVAGPPALSPAYTLNFLEKPTNIDLETDFLFLIWLLCSRVIGLQSIFTIAAPFRHRKRDQIGKNKNWSHLLSRWWPIFFIQWQMLVWMLPARKSVSQTSLHKALCIGRLTYQPHPPISSTGKGQIKKMIMTWMW